MSSGSIVGTLWLPVWFLCGFLTLRFLERRLDIQRSSALPYINLAALFLGPVVLLVLLGFRYFRLPLGGLLNRLRLSDGIRMDFLRSGETVSEQRLEQAAPRTIRRIFKKALIRAVSLQASDLLVEPIPGGAAVMRLKVQGSLQNISRLSAADVAALLRLVVFLAGNEPGEESAAADSKLEFRTTRGVFAFRVGMLKVAGGTRLSFHFVLPERTVETPAELGLDAVQTDAIRQFLALRHGLIVIAGDRGSGRSLTLERILDLADLGSRSAILVSHATPVRLRPEVMRLDGGGKIAVNTVFAALQQSPDLLAVDEVTEPKIFSAMLTAARGSMLAIAVVRAASLPETLQHLFALAPSPKALGEVLQLVIQIHPLRRLCACAQPAVPNLEESAFLGAAGLPTDGLRRPTGCAECAMTGYSGRTAAFDLSAPQGALLPLFAGSKAPAPAEIRQALNMEQGNCSGYLAACRTAALGLTSLEEASVLLQSPDNGR